MYRKYEYLPFTALGGLLLGIGVFPPHFYPRVDMAFMCCGVVLSVIGYKIPARD